MKLEPAAFGGSYPVQVCFKVHMDCLPLSEGTFKKAIMGDSGGYKIKFDIEVTKTQVKKLPNLFRPSTQLMSNVNTLVQSPQPVPIPLVQLRPILPAIATPLHIFHPEALGRYGARLAEDDSLHSAHAANALSDYNKSYVQPDGGRDSGNFSVSSQYSFAGLSFTYR